ncbi:uncharacterized protein PAC_13186 [Phialocephala subalpina]|uniref:Uncharacterized protein n=1 Tax=Phialocephala subalpina TaxID=576137 RepID=A0A1L7XE19_9HELO|nr:uncharacterized protein PAC_13186 [Phialocephala subalpina]
MRCMNSFFRSPTSPPSLQLRSAQRTTKRKNTLTMAPLLRSMKAKTKTVAGAQGVPAQRGLQDAPATHLKDENIDVQSNGKNSIMLAYKDRKEFGLPNINLTEDPVVSKASEEAIAAMPAASRRYEKVMAKDLAKVSDMDFDYVHFIITKYELEVKVEMEIDDLTGEETVLRCISRRCEGWCYNVTRGLGGNRCAVDGWLSDYALLLASTPEADPKEELADSQTITSSTPRTKTPSAVSQVKQAQTQQRTGSAGATTPASLPASFSTTSGVATTSPASSATMKAASTTGTGAGSSSVSSAGGTSTKTTGSQATSVATAATATVTVKSGAGIVEVGSVLLVVLFGGIMAL